MRPIEDPPNSEPKKDDAIELKEIPLDELSLEDQKIVREVMAKGDIDVRAATVQELVDALGWRQAKDVLDKYGSKKPKNI